MNSRRGMNAVDRMVAAFGGNTAFGKIAGVGPSAVSNWRRFGRIPPRLYLTYARAGEARAIRVDPSVFEQMSSPRSGASAA